MQAPLVAVGEGHPGDRVAAEVPPEPGDVEPGVARVGLVHRRQVGDAELPEFAGQLGAGLGIHDAAGVDQRLRRAEQLDALEEERPLLRKEEREPLVHRHLPLVALHLAEVGVERGVERVAGEAEPEVEAGVGIDVSRSKSPPATSRLPSAVAVTNGWASTATPRLRSCSPPMAPFLPEEARVGAADVGPGVGVAGPLDHAGHVEAPALRLAAGVAQALERDPDLDLVALVGDPPLRLPGEVGIQVGAAGDEAADLPGALAPDAVALGAQRVHAEEEGAAAVVEGVDVDDDVVVVVDVVAVGHGGADRGRQPVVGHDAEVDRVRRVPDQDLGLLLGGPAVHRLVLPEAAEPGGLGPGGLVEHAVDLRRRLRAAALARWASPSPRQQRRKRRSGPAGATRARFAGLMVKPAAIVSTSPYAEESTHRRRSEFPGWGWWGRTNA